jgi:mono/diheme cytochrome c family protein
MTGRFIGASAVVFVAILLGCAPGVTQDNRALSAEGQRLFTEQGCYGCHMIEKYGTPIATDLSHAGSRYDLAYLTNWLRDPSVQKPTAHMPKIALTESEARALAAYLAGLR